MPQLRGNETILGLNKWTHLEESAKAKVDFHPHCHHLKKKLE
jgi:hypothetical protein